MCCYVRHLRPLLAAANLPDDRAGRREADRRVRAALGMPDADCPDIWRRVKALGQDARAELLSRPAAASS
jgi:hypothetical protein